MIDPRWMHLADILVNYSVHAQPGERLVIAMGEIETFPLTLAVYESALQVGAYPHVQFNSAHLERALLNHGTDAQIARVPDLEEAGLAWADLYIGLRGARNPYELIGVPPERLIARKRALGALSALRTEGTRWVLARVPNETLAQQARMSLEAMMAFFFNATLRDWQEEARRFEAIRDLFQGGQHVRITGREADLTFSTTGRTYVIGDGRINMPDGEVYTAPLDESAEGAIAFEFPAFYAGETIEGIRLEFQHGEVVRASASRGEAILQHALATDAGARRIGEFGIGVNDSIDRFVGDILFDEKIGGTIHLALGRAYAECGGTNRSAIHWDLVKDLRQEGEISVDGRAVFRNGQFLFA